MATAGGVALGSLYASRARADASLTLVPLAGRLALIQGAAANILVASSGKELLLVDGGSAADARAVLKLLDQKYPGQPLRAVVNTHWHWDQTGFNGTARAHGADVLAHENTRLWLTTTVNSRWENKVYKPQPAAALPNRTFFYGPQQFDFGGSKVEYIHLDPAHTDGDVYVRFAEENVIAAGGVLSPGRYPVIDAATGGWLGGINGALRTIGGVADASTKLVPATGPVAGLTELKQQQDMGNAIVGRMSEIYRKGGTFADFVATNPTRDFDAKFGDPGQFLKLAYETASYQVNPMGGLAGGAPAGAPAPRPPPAAARRRVVRRPREARRDEQVQDEHSRGSRAAFRNGRDAAGSDAVVDARRGSARRACAGCRAGPELALRRQVLQQVPQLHRLGGWCGLRHHGPGRRGRRRDGKIWEEADRRLRGALMPPSSEPQPA